MRNLLVGAALALSTTAYAGPGTSASIGSEFSSVGDGFNGPLFLGGFWPTFDWRADPLILQFHVLEFLAVLAQEEVYIGTNIYLDLVEGSTFGGARGVIQPGVSIDLLGDPFTLGLGATSRFGFETGDQVSVGAYVVPVLGLVISDGDLGLLTGGGVQFSVWFGGSGGGGGSMSSSSSKSSSPPPADDPYDF